MYNVQMYRHRRLTVYYFFLFNKNVQPQFEDYAHVCKELQMCACVTAKSTVELMVCK